MCVSPQDNTISFWSVGNPETSNEDGFEGDPQLLCDQKHNGDVLDLQVRPLWLPAAVQHQCVTFTGPLAQKYIIHMSLIMSCAASLTGCRYIYKLSQVLFCFVFVQFLDQDRIVTASSTGAVTIFRHHQNNQVHTGSVTYL